MTSVVRFEEWQEPTGTSAATVDGSGNVTFANDVTVSGTITSTGNPQGLTFIKSQAIGSGVSSVTVTNAFSATFDNYRILIDVESFGTNTAWGLALGSTTTGYYHSQTGTRYTGAAWSNSATNDSRWLLGGGGTDGAFNTVELARPYLSKKTAYTFTNSYMRTGDGYSANGGGWLNDTTSYTAFTVDSSATTMTGGTITVYGYNNG